MPTPREASIWGKIRNDLSKAQQSILNGQYTQAMILDKSILKTLVRMQIDRAVLVSNNLESDIDQLYENQLISAETRNNYHTIRIFGDQAESGDVPTSQAANESYSLINEELSNYVDSNQTRASIPSYTGSNDYSAQSADDLDDPVVTDDTDTTVASDDYTDDDFDAVPDASAQNTEEPPVRRAFSPDLGGVNIPLTGVSSDGRSTARRRSSRPTRPLRDSERVSRNGGHRSTRNGRPMRSGNKRPKRKQEFELDAYNILKFAIPIACVVLLIILIKIIMGGSDKSTIETTAAPTETAIETEAPMETAAPAETVPETEAVSSIWVTTTGVKVRTEPNTDCQVLDVLDAGVQVTYKGDANEEWIMIDYNGRDAYVSKQFVQPVAAETQAVADAGDVLSGTETAAAAF